MRQAQRQTTESVSGRLSVTNSSWTKKVELCSHPLNLCWECKGVCHRLEPLWALCGMEPLYFGVRRTAVIRPTDNKTACHKSPQKTKAVRLIFAHSVRARTVCCSEGIVSSFFFFFFCWKTETHKIVKLFKYQLASYTQSRHPPSLRRSWSVNSVNRDGPSESGSQEHYHQQLSDFVFALLSRERNKLTMI